jgi:ribose transport system permease protein
VLLFLSGFVASSSTSSQSLNNLVFFATVLAIAALGQHLVIVSGGIDLSVASQIGFGGVLFGYLQNHHHSIAASVAWAVLACAGLGVLNALAVTLLRINPLIATLGVGSLALGAAYSVPGSRVASTLPPEVTTLISTRVIFDFIARPTVMVLVIAIAMALVINRTTVGRRFVAVGAGAAAARLMGVRVELHRAAPYVLASVLYAVCGVVIGGVSLTPGPTMGNQYLLPSIAAVVVGGTALGGGKGSIAATLGGALFITQLDSVTLQLGASEAVQLMIQGAVIVLAVGLYRLNLGDLRLPVRNALTNQGGAGA